VLPRELLLRTAGGCDVDPERLLAVFVEQRQRFVSVIRGFGPGDWSAPTRCADWCAQDVVRHLCDANTIGAGTAHRTLAGFDPRVTPREWLSASQGESTEDTVARFLATTDELVGRVRARLRDGRRFDVDLPYGPMDWTVLLLHGFWDSWIHERDVLLARGVEHPTDGGATFYATAYGVFVAAAVASMFGDPVNANLKLGGVGGGVFDLESGDVVTLTVNRVRAEGPAAADVADALAGRSPNTSALARLPVEAHPGLSHLAGFFNTPVD
jgi:uncharacterized protein (TIGR03083 family)